MDEVTYYSEADTELVERHVQEWFGEYAYVLHEIVSVDIHVDILIVDPTPERDHYTLVTMGMGAALMNIPQELLEDYDLARAELLIALPPDWQVNSSDEAWYWPIRWLKNLARLPFDYDTWLGWGHTVPNGDPPQALAENTELCGFMLTFPYLYTPESFKCRLEDGSEVNFYQLIPLYEAEMNYKLAEGAEALESVLAESDDFDMTVAIDRPCLVETD